MFVWTTAIHLIGCNFVLLIFPPCWCMYSVVSFQWNITLISFLHYFFPLFLFFIHPTCRPFLIPHPPFLCCIPPLFSSTRPSSVLCHLPHQGWALPSSSSHPSRLPGSGFGGSRAHRRSSGWVGRSCPPTSSHQTSGLQRGPAEEQTAAEPWSGQWAGRGAEASPPAPRCPNGQLHSRSLQTTQHLLPPKGSSW